MRHLQEHLATPFVTGSAERFDGMGIVRKTIHIYIWGEGEGVSETGAKKYRDLTSIRMRKRAWGLYVQHKVSQSMKNG